MSILTKLKRFIKNSQIRFGYLNKLGLYRHLSDEEFLNKAYRVHLGKELDLENPQTFNEKLQWLKLYDRNPEYTRMVDKYEAKKYVAEKLGEEYIIPTLGVWNKFEDIDLDELPEQFVLKCTHDSGGLVICLDKKSLDVEAARKKINACLKVNYYWKWREWPYKDVKPRIIAEPYMEDSRDKGLIGLTDYKFFCFNGEPKFLFISRGIKKHEIRRISFLTLDWEFAPYKRTDYSGFLELPDKPKGFDDMIACARILSAGCDFLRVDMYEIEDKIYFSELTFSPCGGFMPFEPKEWDEIMGSWIELHN